MSLRSTLETEMKNFVGDLGGFKGDLLVISPEGVVLGHQGPLTAEETQHFGVLMNGAWQAAEQVSKMASVCEEQKTRLSFDTSSEGVYLLPFNAQGVPLLFVSIYKTITNPGLMKNQMRSFTSHLEEKLTGLRVPQQKSKHLLFDDISDREIDEMFSFAGI
jgi:hypothetical protein